MKIFNYDNLGDKKSWDYTEKGITPEDDGITPILETDKKIDFGDLLIINNIAYYVCSMSGKGTERRCVYVKRLKEQEVFINNEEPKERNYTHEITCPYCGVEIGSWEMDDEEDEYKCEYCGSIFSYQRKITIEYCSQPVRKGKVDQLN